MMIYYLSSKIKRSFVTTITANDPLCLASKRDANALVSLGSSSCSKCAASVSSAKRSATWCRCASSSAVLTSTFAGRSPESVVNVLIILIS